MTEPARVPWAPSRRALVGACVGLAMWPGRRAARGQAAGGPPVSRHSGPGSIVPAVAVPALALTLEDGRRTDLERLTRGRVTALQFVLTGCSSICPLLGAIFARVQAALGGRADLQLVSLSVDPANDTPAAFADWLRSWDAGSSWHGAIPQTDEDGVARLLRSWNLSSGTSSEFHSETIVLIDRQSRLVFRFPDLADPASVSEMMRALAQG